MTTVLDARYRINGLVDTRQPVLANLEKICNACGTWLTYDTHDGKFAVVINKAGASEFSFNDSNIIGPINLSTTGIDKLYNTVKVVYPHEDLKGETDFIQISIPQVDRYANEFENVLNLNYGLVTNPVQAQLLAFIELKQNRVDKIIEFTTDYSKIGVKAGSLIDVTNSVYGFTNKVFRVVTVSETDGDDGSILIKILALEYDATVYSEDMSRYNRTDSNGIAPLASLPQPTKPTIVKTEVSSAPSLAITTTLTGGLVEHVEFWSSTDGGNVYTLLKTANPTTGSNVFPLSTNITIVDKTVASGGFIAKCRSVNSEGVSVFSTPSDAITYTPQQVPDAITDTTAITNNDGSSIGGMLTAAALLKLLNGLNSGSPSSSGLAKSIIQTASAPLSLGAWQFNGIALTGDDTYHDVALTSVTLPFTGNYRITLFINWGGTGTPGQVGVYKASEVKVTGKDLGQWANTGDENVQLYEDHYVQGFFSATANESINCVFSYATDWPTATVWIIMEILSVPNFIN